MLERGDGSGGSGNGGGVEIINEGGGEITVGIPVSYNDVFPQLFNSDTGWWCSCYFFFFGLRG